MDIGFVLLVLILGGFLLASLIRKRPEGDSQEDLFTKQSPYEKYIGEHSTDWNMRWQRKQAIKHKIALKDALREGDLIRVKIQKSMIVYAQSILEYFNRRLK